MLFRCLKLKFRQLNELLRSMRIMESPIHKRVLEMTNNFENNRFALYRNEHVRRNTNTIRAVKWDFFDENSKWELSYWIKVYRFTFMFFPKANPSGDNQDCVLSESNVWNTDPDTDDSVGCLHHQSSPPVVQGYMAEFYPSWASTGIDLRDFLDIDLRVANLVRESRLCQH